MTDTGKIMMSERLLREWICGILNETKQFQDQAIIDRLKAMGYSNFKSMSGVTLAILLDDGSEQARLASMAEVENNLADLGAKWNKQPRGSSSIGVIEVGGNTIMVKPASRQGRGSGGLENEDNLRGAVEAVVAESAGPITVKFIGGGKEYVANNVVGAEDAGSDTKGRKKSDLNLITESGTVPISVKKDNAAYWESADTYWGKQAGQHIKKLLQSGEIDMIDRGGYYNVAPNFAVRASPEERVAVVFGSDILGNGAVVKRTFTPADFSFDAEANTLNVAVSEILIEVSDLDESTMDVWFLVRNDKTRNSVPGYPGIRVLAAYEKRINPNVLRIE